MSELKPCPFCGGEAILESNKLRYGTIYSAYCQKCGAEITGFSEHEAVAAWNRRAQLDNEPLHHIGDTNKMVSLTLEELRGMDGEPVWVETGGVSIGEQLIGRWQICYGDSDGMDRNHKPCRGISFSNGNWKPSDMHGKTWLAYRRRPAN